MWCKLSLRAWTRLPSSPEEFLFWFRANMSKRAWVSAWNCLNCQKTEMCFHKFFCSCLVTDLRVRKIPQTPRRKNTLLICDDFPSWTIIIVAKSFSNHFSYLLFIYRMTKIISAQQRQDRRSEVAEKGLEVKVFSLNCVTTSYNPEFKLYETNYSSLSQTLNYTKHIKKHFNMCQNVFYISPCFCPANLYLSIVGYTVFIDWKSDWGGKYTLT